MSLYQVYENTETKSGTLAISGTTTYYSDAIEIDGEAVSWHFVWTGTPTGTFTLWYSNVPNPGLADDTDWVQDTGFPASNPAGSASKAFISVTGTAGLRVRLKYVNASGSGTLVVWAYVTNGRS